MHETIYIIVSDYDVERNGTLLTEALYLSATGQYESFSHTHIDLQAAFRRFLAVDVNAVEVSMHNPVNIKEVEHTVMYDHEISDEEFHDN